MFGSKKEVLLVLAGLFLLIGLFDSFSYFTGKTTYMSCVDTDNGKNIKTFGEVYGYLGGSTVVQKDTCLTYGPPGGIYEYYCSEVSPGVYEINSEIYDCEAGH